MILHETPLIDIWRLLSGLGATLSRAKDGELLDFADLALGDYSPGQVLDENDSKVIEERALETGIRDFSYTPFGANLGHSGGHNRLALESNNDFLLLMNPDTYASPLLAGELLRTAKDPNIGIAEARHIPLEHPKYFDPVSGDTSWASACCLLIGHKAFSDVGGFDDSNFPLYCDDVDLSWRVRLAGYRVVQSPKAIVFHDKRISNSGLPVLAPKEEYFGALGRLMLAVRYGRSDVLGETIDSIENAGSEEQLAAVAEFRRRQRLGKIPQRIEGAETVAEFVSGNYAVHRF